jgi:hypothetical protein
VTASWMLSQALAFYDQLSCLKGRWSVH